MDIAALEKLLGSDRDTAMLRLTLASSYHQQQDSINAIKHAQNALQLDPDYTAAWKLLGQLHAESGDTKAASHAWEQGIQASVRRGDVQTGKMLQVFLRRLQK